MSEHVLPPLLLISHDMDQQHPGQTIVNIPFQGESFATLKAWRRMGSAFVSPFNLDTPLGDRSGHSYEIMFARTMLKSRSG